MDRAFLIVLSRVIGLRFFGGPFGLPGFCRAINSPELILRDSCSSKTLFIRNAVDKVYKSKPSVILF